MAAKPEQPPERVIIMGAAGRDFHNFNVHFRDDPRYQVVAFTATQIPNIADRTYPPELAGELYPDGIPIYPEAELDALIRRHRVDQVVFSYSDVAHAEVMHKASSVLAAGADFVLLGPKSTWIESRLPVIAVCAVRTGAGKSPVSRYVVDFLKRAGLRVAVVRHPMPYGDLIKEEVQRFQDYADFERAGSTIEEREEYEPYLERGVVVFAGVDYEKILRLAENEADIILWDGGNNDLPFYPPALHITIADPHRAGHELTYHPGEANLRSAHVILIGKTGSAPESQIAHVEQNARSVNPAARIIRTDLALRAENAGAISGKRVIVIEDGPTLTHGEMDFGAGTIIARRCGATVVDAARSAVGSIADIYRKFPHLHGVLPAMGYSPTQIHELECTINAADADAVVEATPVNLKRLIRINKPIVEVNYELAACAELDEVLSAFVVGLSRSTTVPAPGLMTV